MIDLYISKSIYTSCQKDAELYKLLHNRSTQIWLDAEESEIDESVNSLDDFVLNNEQSQGLRTTPKSGKYMLDRMRNGEKIESGLSKAILILDDIEDEKASEITSNYGVLCLTKRNFSEKIKDLKKKSRFTTIVFSKEEGMEIGKGTAPDQSTEKGWEYYFAPFKNLPCNTLIFIDRYLDNDKYCSNIKNIIFENVKGRKIKELPIHILIISGDAYGSKLVTYLNDILPKLVKTETTLNKNGVTSLSLKEIASKYDCKFFLEFVYLDGTTEDQLYKHSHNRQIFSNYWSLDVPAQINAFRYKEEKVLYAIAEQTIQVQGLFADGFDDSNKYVQSVEDSQSSILDSLAIDFKDGFIPLDEKTKMGNRRRTYRAYEIDKTNVVNSYNQSNNQKVMIKNRLIMDKIILKEGDDCKYLSLPFCNDWKNITVNTGTYKGNGEYDNCIVVKKGDRKTLNGLIDKIKGLFKNIDQNRQVKGEEGIYYRIVTTYPSELKTLHVISSKQCEKPKDQYEGNRFKHVTDAMRMCNEICKILGLEQKYTDDIISLSEREYLFKPYVPEDFQFKGKKILVVGASHNCPHCTDCRYFCDCTSCDIALGNSRIYNKECPHKITNKDNQELPLEDYTKYVIESFLNNEGEIGNNKSFSNFTAFMCEYFGGDDKNFRREFWKHVAFVNYAQNFESQNRGNHFSEDDFKAFNKYLEEIKPNVVIVWGSELGNELRARGVKPDEKDEVIKKTNHYYWNGKGDYNDIKFVNCYHPCNNKKVLEDYGKFAKAMDKIFNPKGDAEEPQI